MLLRPWPSASLLEAEGTRPRRGPGREAGWLQARSTAKSLPLRYLQGSHAAASVRLPQVGPTPVTHGHQRLFERPWAKPARHIEPGPRFIDRPRVPCPPNGCRPTMAPVGLSLRCSRAMRKLDATLPPA
jgi:hypothetical protein